MSHTQRSAAAALREVARPLRALSPGHVRHLVLGYLRRRYTVADLIWCLDRGPDGTPRTWTTAVRSPAGWLVHRLRPWAEVEAPSVVRGREHAAQLAEQAARVAAADAARAAAATAEQRKAHRERIAAALERARRGISKDVCKVART